MLSTEDSSFKWFWCLIALHQSEVHRHFAYDHLSIIIALINKNGDIINGFQTHYSQIVLDETRLG